MPGDGSDLGHGLHRDARRGRGWRRYPVVRVNQVEVRDGDRGDIGGQVGGPRPTGQGALDLRVDDRAAVLVRRARAGAAPWCTPAIGSP